MNEIVSSRYVRIAWTERRTPTTQPPTWIENFKFSPTVEEVVCHLVTMATVVASKCPIENVEFYEDLNAIYEFLNNPEHLTLASNIIRVRFDNEAVWLNDNNPLERIARSTRPGINSTFISSLSWVRAKSILQDIPYDLPKSKLYCLKSSIERYSELLSACGSTGIDSPEVELTEEDSENHGNKILGSLKLLRESPDSLCDFSIIIERKTFKLHRMLIIAVSKWFEVMESSGWKESKTGVLNLDDDVNNEKAELELTPTAETDNSHPTKCIGRLYGTAESVAAVIEWVYTGVIELDDRAIENDVNAIIARLELYFDILQLADVWEIPLLRVHVENRVLEHKKTFIGPETVRAVQERANEYHAQKIVMYCQEYVQINGNKVEIIENDGEE